MTKQLHKDADWRRIVLLRNKARAANNQRHGVYAETSGLLYARLGFLLHVLDTGPCHRDRLPKEAAKLGPNLPVAASSLEQVQRHRNDETKQKKKPRACRPDWLVALFLSSAPE